MRRYGRGRGFSGMWIRWRGHARSKSTGGKNSMNLRRKAVLLTEREGRGHHRLLVTVLDGVTRVRKKKEHE